MDTHFYSYNNNDCYNYYLNVLVNRIYKINYKSTQVSSISAFFITGIIL